MKIYLSGAVSAGPDYKQKFDAVADKLKQAGHSVLNPASLPEGMKKADYMSINFQMLFTADLVGMLPDWHQSAGARLEYALCQYIAKPVIFYDAERNCKR